MTTTNRQSSPSYHWYCHGDESGSCDKKHNSLISAIKHCMSDDTYHDRKVVQVITDPTTKKSTDHIVAYPNARIYNSPLNHAPYALQAYQALIQTSMQIKLPEAYETDLTLHDMEQLLFSPRPPIMFGYVFSTVSTRLFDVAYRENAIEYANYIRDSFDKKDITRQLYFYDSESLQKIDTIDEWLYLIEKANRDLEQKINSIFSIPERQRCWR